MSIADNRREDAKPSLLALMRKLGRKPTVKEYKQWCKQQEKLFTSDTGGTK